MGSHAHVVKSDCREFMVKIQKYDCANCDQRKMHARKKKELRVAHTEETTNQRRKAEHTKTITALEGSPDQDIFNRPRIYALMDRERLQKGPGMCAALGLTECAVKVTADFIQWAWSREQRFRRQPRGRLLPSQIWCSQSLVQTATSIQSWRALHSQWQQNETMFLSFLEQFNFFIYLLIFYLRSTFGGQQNGDRKHLCPSFCTAFISFLNTFNCSSRWTRMSRRSDSGRAQMRTTRQQENKTAGREMETEEWQDTDRGTEHQLSVQKMLLSQGDNISAEHEDSLIRYVHLPASSIMIPAIQADGFHIAVARLCSGRARIQGKDKPVIQCFSSGCSHQRGLAKEENNSANFVGCFGRTKLKKYSFFGILSPNYAADPNLEADVFCLQKRKVSSRLMKQC